MLFNKYIAIYGLFLSCSLLVGLLAAGYGLMVLLRRRANDSPERRHHLGKYLYLCASAMFIGALIRLVMIPLWFLMLHSLIPTIPGAMCLAGLHLNVPRFAWAASSMKLILPWLYFSWIFITRLDRRIPEQPFFTLRQTLLVPLIFFLFMESFLDIGFLTGLRPTPVTCCTAIFDFNTAGVPTVLTQTHSYFIYLFGGALLAQWLLWIPGHPGRWVHLATMGLSITLFFSLILALHTRLSPLLLDSPFHHCIFCLLQSNFWVLLGFAISLAAIYLDFALGMTAFFNWQALQAAGGFKRGKIAFCVLSFAGAAFIAIPTIIHLFTVSGGI